MLCLPAWLCLLCRPGACRGLEEGMGSSGSGVTFAFESLCGCWEWNARSSAGITSALNQRAISLAPVWDISKELRNVT